MLDEFTRTRMLLGEEAMERLRPGRVAVFESAAWAAMPWRRLPAAASARST